MAETRVAGAAGRRASTAGGDAPRTVGRYRIVARLGAGGMGQVFRAHDPELDRHVAVKLLHRGGDGTAPAQGLELRLIREAQAMARLSHPNLAVVHDVGREGDEVYVAMELIDGDTLRAWLARPRRWRERLAALIAAGRGLAAAHGAGVVHRDFKPDNVLVARDGTVKVVDFGLARAVGEVDPRAPTAPPSPIATPMTVTGAVMGTPAYMAPEQRAGEPADARADQFAFAVATYEALYGVRPFRGAGLDYAAQAAAGTIEPPARAEVPAAVFAALRRALAPEPGARYPSMDALLAALERAARPARWPWFAAGGLAVAGTAALALMLSAGRGDDGRRGRRGGGGDARGQLGVDQIAAVIAAHEADVRACRLEALRERATLAAGAVVVTFSIDADGRVRSTRYDDAEAPTPELAACLAAAAMRWQFPPPAGGAARVRHRFELPAVTPPAFERGPDGAVRVPRAVVQAWFEDPLPLMTARLVPSARDGAPSGLRLFAITPGSTLEALGVQSGDTLRRIDGVDVTGDPAGLAVLVERLPSTSRVVVELERRGAPVELVIEIVD